MAIAAVNLKGFRELEAALKNLDAKVANQILRKAVTLGAGVIRKRARQLAPRKSGKLRSSISIKLERRSQTGLTAKIGPRKGSSGARHAHLVEFGTAAHLIQVKKKRGMKGKDGTFYGRTARHPGTPARPFLRPALDTAGNDAVRVMRDQLRTGIEAEATKARGARGAS